MLPTVKRMTTSLKCRFVLSLLCAGTGHAPMAVAQSQARSPLPAA